ncbi:hypothetical protein [Cellulomonas sp. Y8]|uniref:hypothetical protein n=1 Tax=Cellulomonas sp. Y8 TaxID=2591145 RepID=UPI0011C7A5B9|nr:hypothetical protein [Cellulomonas sp. Y8]
MTFDPWGLVSIVVIFGVVLLTRVVVRRATASRQPDYREEGRRIRDMTPASKAVAVLAGVALVGVVVTRSLDPVPGLFWVCVAVVIGCGLVVAVSEYRRVRRDPRLPEYRGERPPT